MNFIVSARTDIGNVKSTNQDSVMMRVANTPLGRMAFAVVSDGMGGLEKGEVASAALVRAFDHWFRYQLPNMCGSELRDGDIREQWEQIISEQNQSLKIFGKRHGVNLGTTVVALLLTQTRYFLLNVGDSRAYEISDAVRQLTTDQTFVAREVALGNMTEKQALTDERRNVLLQCVGASDEVYPEILFGEPNGNAVYMLCTDGFRHEVSVQEFYQKLSPKILLNEAVMNRHSEELIDLNKTRGERDNISVALIRTF